VRLIGNVILVRAGALNRLSVNVVNPELILISPENAQEAIVVIPLGIITTPLNAPEISIPVTVVFAGSSFNVYDMSF